MCRFPHKCSGLFSEVGGQSRAKAALWQLAALLLQNALAALHDVNLDVQIAWQAQGFVDLEAQISWRQRFVSLKVQTSWQKRRFVNLEVQILWQAQHMCSHMCALTRVACGNCMCVHECALRCVSLSDCFCKISALLRLSLENSMFL